MNQENDRSLKTVLLIYLGFAILQSAIWFINSYIIIPWQAGEGSATLSSYLKVQGVISSFLQLIHLVLIIIITVMVKDATFRIVLCIYAFIQLIWLLWPAVVLIKEHFL